MTDEKRRAISWVTRPGRSNPEHQDLCTVEEYQEYAESKGVEEVEWAVEEWDAACEEWRGDYRYKKVGIEEDQGDGHGVWAADHCGNATETQYFANYRDAYRRWKELWHQRM